MPSGTRTSAVTVSSPTCTGAVSGAGQENPAVARCRWTAMQPAIRASAGRILITTRLPSASSVPMTSDRWPERNRTRAGRAPRWRSHQSARKASSGTVASIPFRIGVGAGRRPRPAQFLPVAGAVDGAGREQVGSPPVGRRQKWLGC
jgi:hypothetical protein